jgi:hypothetical protein
LESFDNILSPLKQQGNVEEADKAVRKAEKEWSLFLEKERKRTREIERPKLVKRRKAAAEAQVEEIKSRWTEGTLGAEGWEGRWKRVKRVVERAIVDAGASNEIDAVSEKAGWKSVTKEAIEGVDAADRKKYTTTRNQVESDIQRLRKDAADGSVDESEQTEVHLFV